MNKMKITVVSFILLISAAMANSGNKIIDTSEAVTTALTAFENDNDQATVDLFKGIKAAPRDHGVSVNIYLTDGVKQTYKCHRHDDSAPFECHQSN